MTAASPADSVAVPNRVKRRMAAGELAIALMVRMARTADIGPIAAACDFDAIYVDMEHGTIPLDVTALGAGVTPLVRVPSPDPSLIGRVLDGGCQGVIVPHVESVADAAAVVAATRFPPHGHRSMGGAGPVTRFRSAPPAEFCPAVDAATLVTVMIESRAGLDVVDGILALPGIDMILVGTNDLCADLGVPGELGHPSVRAAYATMAQACKCHGKHLGIGGIKTDMALLADMVDLGAGFISANTDMALLLAAARTNASQLRALRR
jgi:4-hydroxy-2-oxoheptanedioate aldolase